MISVLFDTATSQNIATFIIPDTSVRHLPARLLTCHYYRFCKIGVEISIHVSPLKYSMKSCKINLICFKFFNLWVWEVRKYDPGILCLVSRMFWLHIKYLNFAKANRNVFHSQMEIKILEETYAGPFENSPHIMTMTDFWQKKTSLRSKGRTDQRQEPILGFVFVNNRSGVNRL